MGKILFWLVIFFAVLMVVRVLSIKAQQPRRRPGPQGGGARSAGSARAGEAEAMVRCAHCGIHLPRSEAYMQQGQTWCSSEHARLGVRA
jgi:uncharacterized protein